MSIEHAAETDPQSSDGGALRRIARRTARAALVPASAAGLLALLAWGWPGWFTAPAGVVVTGLVAAALVAHAAVLTHRATLWRATAPVLARWQQWHAEQPAGAVAPDGWASATCGAPQPLHPMGGPRMLRRARRFPAHVLPVRSQQGALAAGEAVFVHGRADGLLPETGDVLAAYALGPRGPILLGRRADGALFAADRWSVSNL